MIIRAPAPTPRQIVEKLAVTDVKFTDEQLAKLFSFSENSLRAASVYIDYLIHQQILTPQFLSALIDKLCLQLATVASRDIAIDKNKDSFALHLDNHDYRFTPKQVDYHATFWRGQLPHQKYHEFTLLLKESRDKNIAKKEAKYSGFFHPVAFTLKGTICFVTNWTQGLSLDILQYNAAHYSIKDRLKWLVSYWRKLTKLHAMWRVHNDIYAGNVVVNTEINEAFLIDHECAMKVRDLKLFRVDVIESCGQIVSAIFPEMKFYQDLIRHSDALDPAIVGLYQLYRCATAQDKSLPVFTSEQALMFSIWMHDEYETLSLDVVSEKAASMLHADANTAAQYLLYNHAAPAPSF